MATYHGIAAVSQAIVDLMKDACPRDEFPDAQFEVFLSDKFKEGMPEGVSVYLYRVAMNVTRRNLPPRVDPDGTRYRPALPLDLHYMVTPWGRDAAKQQHLLGWSMRLLEDTPILGAGMLNRHAAAPDTFHPNETVEVVYEPLSLQEIVNIWDVFKPSMQLSVSYVARMVPIDSKIPRVEAAPVQTREYAMGAANMASGVAE